MALRWVEGCSPKEALGTRDYNGSFNLRFIL